MATLNEIGIDGEWVLSGKEAVERAVKRHENGNDYFVYIIDWQMREWMELKQQGRYAKR